MKNLLKTVFSLLFLINMLVSFPNYLSSQSQKSSLIFGIKEGYQKLLGPYRDKVDDSLYHSIWFSTKLFSIEGLFLDFELGYSRQDLIKKSDNYFNHFSFMPALRYSFYRSEKNNLNLSIGQGICYIIIKHSSTDIFKDSSQYISLNNKIGINLEHHLSKFFDFFIGVDGYSINDKHVYVSIIPYVSLSYRIF